MHDPLFRSIIQAARDADLNSLLVATAAYQRGLEVTFYRIIPVQTFLYTTPLGFRGELFSISDGRRKHYFNRTIGDLTSADASRNSKDKHTTKRILEKASIRVPKGIILYPSQIKLAESFMNTHPELRYLIKPFNGSLSRGVYRDLTPLEALKVIESSAEERLILEHYLKGDEFRVYVTASQVVAAYKREPVNVVGDGHSSIRSLINQKNDLRKQNPSLVDSLILVTAVIENNLRCLNMTLDSVPQSGEKVILQDTLQRREGADQIDWTNDLAESVKSVAIDACSALSLPNAGVDIICVDGIPYVLELNARAVISPHTYPLYGLGTGNAVAEAIVSMYFPQSHKNRRFPKAFINIYRINNALQSGAVQEITLPTLKNDWVHERVKIEINATEQNQKNLRDQMLYLGLYGEVLRVKDRVHLIDFCGPKTVSEEFIGKLRDLGRPQN